MAVFIAIEIAFLIALYVILRPIRHRNREDNERRYEIEHADERIANLRKFDREYTGITVSGTEGVSPSSLSWAISQAIRNMEAFAVENAELRAERDALWNAR